MPLKSQKKFGHIIKAQIILALYLINTYVISSIHNTDFYGYSYGFGIQRKGGIEIDYRVIIRL